MERTIRFTPAATTLGNWWYLLNALTERYPDPGVELKPAGDMKRFLLILPQKTWGDDDAKFFNWLLNVSDMLAFWELIDC